MHESVYWILTALFLSSIPYAIVWYDSRYSPSQTALEQIAATVFVIGWASYLVALVVRYLVFLVN